MAEKRRLRYALVGAGNIAQEAVLPAFDHARENSELVAIVSGTEEKRKGLGERYGVGHLGGYEDFERVLEASQADAVYIALPNHLHREYTERAAAVGVHVLCEKPMALSVADCRAMIAACEAAGVRLMIAYRLHFEEANLRAIELARSGALGDPRLLSAALTHQVRGDDIRMQAEVGGGALLDAGIYCINAARYLFQDEPVEVSCFANVGRHPRSHGVDETTVALLRFPDGRLAHFAVSQVTASVSNFHLIGSSGDVYVENAFSYAKERELEVTRGGDSEKHVIPARDQFAPELLYFSRAVLEDFEPEPSGWEGLADVRVIQALQESARIGKSVALPPYERARRPDAGQQIARPAVQPPEPIDAPSPTDLS